MLWNFDPLRELERMRRDLDSLFGATGRPAASASFPLVNVYDAKDDVIVNAELPGLTKSDVNITFSDGTLTISGRQNPADKTEGMTVIRQERSIGEFEKALKIPVKVQQDKVGAVFKDGVLTITLPKAEEAKPKQIAIEVR